MCPPEIFFYNLMNSEEILKLVQDDIFGLRQKKTCTIRVYPLRRVEHRFNERRAFAVLISILAHSRLEGNKMNEMTTAENILRVLLVGDPDLIRLTCRKDVGITPLELISDFLHSLPGVEEEHESVEHDRRRWFAYTHPELGEIRYASYMSVYCTAPWASLEVEIQGQKVLQATERYGTSQDAMDTRFGSELGPLRHHRPVLNG